MPEDQKQRSIEEEFDAHTLEELAHHWNTASVEVRKNFLRSIRGVEACIGEAWTISPLFHSNQRNASPSLPGWEKR